MAASALIFDLDGTVWDSASWFAAGIRGDDPKAAEELRLEFINGGNIIGALKRAGITRHKLIRQAQLRAGPPPLFDGMGDALAKLSARGTALAVATSLPGALAVPMIKAAGLSEVFDAVVHAGVCRTAKPHPASINMALRMIGQTASAAIYYVGDRQSDARAAAAARVSFAWVRHGYEQPAPASGIITMKPDELLSL